MVARAITFLARLSRPEWRGRLLMSSVATPQARWLARSALARGVTHAMLAPRIYLLLNAALRCRYYATYYHMPHLGLHRGTGHHPRHWRHRHRRQRRPHHRVRRYCQSPSWKPRRRLYGHRCFQILTHVQRQGHGCWCAQPRSFAMQHETALAARRYAMGESSCGSWLTGALRGCRAPALLPAASLLQN